jgi:hypothetical protein
VRGGINRNPYGGAWWNTPSNSTAAPELKEPLLPELPTPRQLPLNPRAIDRAFDDAARDSNNSSGVPPPYRVPRGTLLPFADDWTDDIRRLQEYETPRGRAQRNIRNIAIIGLGGVTAREGYTTWKERAKWMIKNSGSPYEAKMPVTIPIDGPADLDPGNNLPVYPAQPNPRQSIERSNAGSQHANSEYDRAIVSQLERNTCCCDC